MKVVHFTPIYMDGWGYQDNLLPKYFKIKGHDVCVITLKRLPPYSKKKNNLESKYFLDGTEIRRLYVLFYFSHTFFATRHLYKNLKELKPEILFHHGVSFNSLIVCGIYKMVHPKCILFLDSHTDEINQTSSKLKLLIYSKILLRFIVNILSPLIKKFYGVSYSRCDYLESVFKINKNKIDFLPIGADTLAIDEIELSKDEIKYKYNIPQNSFIIVSGGKMGMDKGTDILISAVEKLNKNRTNVKLVLFGLFNDSYTQKLADRSNDVLVMGWCNRATTLKLLKMADVAIWPIHHTTLIEDSIACLTPLILRKTRTTEHLIEGNGVFIEQGTKDEIVKAINRIMKSNQIELINQCNFMRDKIDYRKIVDKIVMDSFS